ncbi:putative protein N(5)-glutamine methyltransferase [Streptomyces sp. BI20]|uniref:putative protein N(5)-glutamine methyltransferase n=1 Tax=Streptomyces sp. BI20 TaxID=3403460 RepID=UPI003C77E87B
MTPPPPPPAGSLVDRLRAAGCVFAEEEADILVSVARDDGELSEMLARRVAGEPLEHVVGHAEFDGLRVTVGPGAFVPRRRSEFLAAEAAGLVRAGHVVVDLCCGVGALGAAVARRAGVPVELHVADLSPIALVYARRNVSPYGGRVHRGDLFGALPTELRGRVDVLVVNAPYVPTGEIGLLPPEAREHEPLAALDGGPDGLAHHRAIAAAAPAWLAPGGALLIETSGAQAAGTVAACEAAGLRCEVREHEPLDATVVLARA